MTETIVHIYYNFTKNNPGCVLKVYLNGSLIAARRTIDLWTFNSFNIRSFTSIVLYNRYLDVLNMASGYIFITCGKFNPPVSGNQKITVTFKMKIN